MTASAWQRSTTWSPARRSCSTRRSPATPEPISLFRDDDGTYYALDDTCSHEDASLAEGWIEAGEVECPLHATRFCLRDGKPMCLPATKPVRDPSGRDPWRRGLPLPRGRCQRLTCHRCSRGTKVDISAPEIAGAPVPHGAQWASARCRARSTGITETVRRHHEVAGVGEDVPATSGGSDGCRDAAHQDTRGLFVHGAPAALCPHITWAIEAVLDQRVTLDWIPQPAAPRMVRTELTLGRRPPAPAPSSPAPCAAGTGCATR